MRIKPISSLPTSYERGRRDNNQLKNAIQAFYDSDAEFAEVEFTQGEYSSNMSLYSGVRKAIQALALPIHAEMIRGGVYLSRAD